MAFLSLCCLKRKPKPLAQSSISAPPDWDKCPPEVLEVIFQNLSQRTRRQTIDLVSKNWRNANYRCLRRLMSLGVNHPLEPHRDILKRIDRLKSDPGNAKIQVLQILCHDHYCFNLPGINRLPYMKSSVRERHWSELLQALGVQGINPLDNPSVYSINPSLRTPPSILDRVSQCHLSGEMDITVFLPILPMMASSLVVLTMGAISSGAQFILSKVLLGCPQLRHLIVRPQGEVVSQQSATSRAILALPEFNAFDPQILVNEQEEETTGQRQTFKLQTLILTNAPLPQTLMESILSRSPCLRNLQIASKQRTFQGSLTPSWDYRAFLLHVAKTCKNLDTFHLSSTQNSISAAIRALEFNLFKSSVKHWSFAQRDCEPWLLRKLTTIDSCVTSLEVTPSAMNRHDRRWLPALHDFLCTNVHLKHLRAACVMHHAEYMDVNKVVTRELKERGAFYVREYDGRTWGCRGLRTLHLEIRFGVDGNTGPENRIIYGYLSRVSPFLEELVIRRPYIHFDIEHGFCLLSRLHRLDHLELHCRAYAVSDTNQFQWARRTTSKSVMNWKRGKNKRTVVHQRDSSSLPWVKTHRVLEAAGSGQQVTDSVSQHDANFKHLGMMKDVEEVHRNLVEEEETDCWMLLESLVVRSEAYKIMDTPIHKLLPGVRILFPILDYSNYRTFTDCMRGYL
ncbi:hypothetical protein BG004_004886 [Podila humilis]|nr:hypothetical protein BG004_004886 [Podila humilis]